MYSKMERMVLRNFFTKKKKKKKKEKRTEIISRTFTPMLRHANDCNFFNIAHGEKKSSAIDS